MSIHTFIPSPIRTKSFSGPGLIKTTPSLGVTSSKETNDMSIIFYILFSNKLTRRHLHQSLFYLCPIKRSGKLTLALTLKLIPIFDLLPHRHRKTILTIFNGNNFIHLRVPRHLTPFLGMRPVNAVAKTYYKTGEN